MSWRARQPFLQRQPLRVTSDVSSFENPHSHSHFRNIARREQDSHSHVRSLRRHLIKHLTPSLPCPFLHSLAQPANKSAIGPHLEPTRSRVTSALLRFNRTPHHLSCPPVGLRCCPIYHCISLRALERLKRREEHTPHSRRKEIQHRQASCRVTGSAAIGWDATYRGRTKTFAICHSFEALPPPTT